MKKFISIFIVVILLCANAFAENSYTVVNMSEFSQIENYSEGLCAVLDSTSGRWGFVDAGKNWVILPQFKSASYFKNGLCAVNTVDGESVLIDHNGTVVFKRSGFNGMANSDNFYVEKHGKYNIIFDGHVNYGVTLLDENYNTITKNDVSLSTFTIDSFKSPYGSKTLFWENNKGRVYNYKGIDITEKLTSENIGVYSGMTVNDKYIVGQADNKIKCFDILGNKIAEFNNTGEASLDGNMIICNNRVHNIADNETVFENDSIDVAEIVTYYSKFFTVKKRFGTSALFSADGKVLIDFGKWDFIYPSSVSQNIVVSANGKYGVADYSGNLLLPLKYDKGTMFTSKKFSLSHSQLSDDGRYGALTNNGNTVIIDLLTLKCFDLAVNHKFYTGYKYHRAGSHIIDNDFNIVYTDKSTNYIGLGLSADLKNGVLQQMYGTKPLTYDIIIFNDSGVKVQLDNTCLVFDVLPVIQNGRTLVPMRAIFEALGAEIEWEEQTQTITAKNKDVVIQMQIGNNTLIKNGQSTQMDVCPQLVNGRTMVPVRAISDSFSVTVDWDGYSQTVLLFTN